jgi:hypothetical protein
MSPVAELSGIRLCNLLFFFFDLLPTEFRRAGLELQFCRIPEQKMKNIQGYLLVEAVCEKGSLETSLGSHKWSVPRRLNSISRRNHITPRKFSSDMCNLTQCFISDRGNHHYGRSVVLLFLNYDHSRYN